MPKQTVQSSATPAAGISAPKPLRSPSAKEYTSAVSFFGEETMSKACALLLSDDDYVENVEGDASDANASKTIKQSDYDQLFGIFKQCQASLCTIEKYEDQASAAAKERRNPPPQNAHPVGKRHKSPIPGVRPNARKPRIMQPPPARASLFNKPVILPHHGTASSTSHSQQQQPIMRGMLNRQSDTSTTGAPTTGGHHHHHHHSHKKPSGARLMSPSTEPKSKAPPPVALSFLAALNDNGSDSGKTIPSPKPSHTSQKRKTLSLSDDRSMKREGGAEGKTDSSAFASPPHSPNRPRSHSLAASTSSHSSRSPGSSPEVTRSKRKRSKSMDVSKSMDLVALPSLHDDEADKEKSQSLGRAARLKKRKRVAEAKNKDKKPSSDSFDVGQEVIVIVDDEKEEETLKGIVMCLGLEGKNVTYMVELDNGDVWSDLEASQLQAVEEDE